MWEWFKPHLFMVIWGWFMIVLPTLYHFVYHKPEIFTARAQLLDCATVRQLRVPQALASSRAYWECTVSRLRYNSDLSLLK